MADPALAPVVGRVLLSRHASFGACLTVIAPGLTSSPGRNAVAARSAKSKLRYQPSRSSVMWDRCIVRPLAEIAVASAARVPEGLEVRDPGRPETFLLRRREPRKSSDRSGMRSAPGIPAAMAIFFGRLCPPSKPPPANPLRMLVGSKAPRRSNNSFAPSSMWTRLSLRRRNATSFCSRIVAFGSLGKRIGVEHAATGFPFAFEARPSSGQVPGGRTGDVAPEVGQSPRHRDAET